MSDGCWYCENDKHICSACGDPVTHDEAFCEDCYAIVHGEG
jgi:predicted amidophosphoribosyltransferase